MYDENPEKLILAVAKKLQDLISKPDWADFVKTGQHKERPPVREDWWYIRAAAVLRTVHLRGPIGVSKLATKFGGRKDRGVRPSHFSKGGKGILRRILQQLEHAELIKQDSRGVHKGRVMTPKGNSLLFGTAKEIGLSSKKSSLVAKVKVDDSKVKVDKSKSKPVETGVVETKAVETEVVKTVAEGDDEKKPSVDSSSVVSKKE